MDRRGVDYAGLHGLKVVVFVDLAPVDASLETFFEGRKLDEVSNSRLLSLSSTTRGFLQMSFKVPFLLSLLVIHLKYPLWLPLLKDIFTPEFLRKAHAFFTEPDELVTEFSAEV